MTFKQREASKRYYYKNKDSVLARMKRYTGKKTNESFFPENLSLENLSIENS